MVVVLNRQTVDARVHAETLAAGHRVHRLRNLQQVPVRLNFFLDELLLDSVVRLILVQIVLSRFFGLGVRYSINVHPETIVCC